MRIKTFEKFEALNTEKKYAIINASMDEFIKGGYEKASMNRLVEKAGISKGSLFYYFLNKKTLYLYLFEYTMSIVMETASQNTGDYDDDFINRIMITVKRNADVLERHPRLFAFMNSCKIEKSDQVVEAIAIVKSKYSECLFRGLYLDINKALFKDDIDVDIAVYTIKTTLFQVLHEYSKEDDLKKEDVIAKLEKFEVFFKKTLYR